MTAQSSPRPWLEAYADNYHNDEVVHAHCHAEAQLIHGVSGVMLVSTAQGSWLVPSGHALWVPAGTAHEIRMAGDVHMRTLFLAPDAEPELGRVCQVIEVSALLRELIVAATLIAGQNSPRMQAMIELIRMELLTAPVVAMHVPVPAEARLARLCTHFIRNPSDDSSLQAWADILNMSTRTLSRIFQRELGMSFGEWRKRARLALSLKLLAQGVSILEVALEHGYQSPSAFSAMFRRAMGYPPSHFRPGA
ncbi:AraC family transcriptional regulator [Pseudomonas fluorescens]|jgi:AraC-like DNA-binding protein|uniref:HTH-type transcriptional regulator NimR n=4 Tax=Pseudomonas TaxID=286 RepID=A0A5M9J134_9PSED|nr:MULTISPECIES: helix-turn-helix transcriptional regulator [Pseudomonas]AHC34702.1 AraC family transcriptional regulator [Pseudomonas sp. TKP]AOE67210.1 AraC family transcriptional regulator [Pseudomonas fluorescens]AOE73037.1 AraC family transcriptional regulator [Pseudomonas fluorescens]KAA6179509.1 AraC family transcriptional regulator [Pseudomonas veronii]KAA6180264.1 AraC family transcriptional regulator [Pseudomonas veronii]